MLLIADNDKIENNELGLENKETEKDLIKAEENRNNS